MRVGRVGRIGFTPVKGARHLAHGSATLTPAGPVGDRVFCLVDPAVDRCLRTVDHPALLRSSATWDGATLAVELPSGRAVGPPVPTGDVRTVDYWGRAAPVEVVDGPWAAAYAALLGRDVVLARATPGDVVYGAPVTLVTSSSLARVADRVGGPVDDARFRATFRLDGHDLTPWAEEGWVGRRLRLGTAEVRVRSVVPRCAVIDHHPHTAVRDLALLKALAPDHPAQVRFGVDAEVTAPGRVTTGDAATLLAG